MRERYPDVSLRYTIMEKQGVFQLGLPGAVPVPGSDDEKSPKRKGQTSRPGPNKAGRQTATARVEGPPGLPPGPGEGSGQDSKQLTISMSDFERLLDRQSATILKANREHAQGLMDALEARHAGRLDALEGDMSKIQGGMGSIEKRLEALEKGAQARGWEPRGTEARRRQTLVFGGWDRDTKREKVLRELQEAIEGLGLEQLVSEEAFTTGPRKSVALMNFPLKANETDEDRRNRMHEMVLSVSKANARTSAGKRLWCSYSRTKEQRDVSSHCGWLKRALGSIDADWARELDVEYATGSAGEQLGGQLGERS